MDSELITKAGQGSFPRGHHSHQSNGLKQTVSGTEIDRHRTPGRSPCTSTAEVRERNGTQTGVLCLDNAMLPHHTSKRLLGGLVT